MLIWDAAVFGDNAIQLATLVTMRGFSQVVLSLCVIVSMFWPFRRSKLLWSGALLVNYAAILSLAASFASSLPAWTTLFAIGISIGTSLSYAALTDFAGRPIRYREVLAPPMACLAMGIAAYWQFDIAIFVLYAINALQFLLMGNAAYRIGRDRSRIGGKLLLTLGCVVASSATFYLAINTQLWSDNFVTGYGVMTLGTALATIMQNLGWLALQKDSAEIQLEQLAHIDGLTGLRNRRGFALDAQRVLRSARRLDRAVAVLLIDIDHFKSVNDRWGHDEGDQVLAKVGAALLEQMRPDDVCGRFGGEEFVLVLADADPRGAHRAAERLREAVADRVHLPDGSPIRFSAGIAALRPGEENFDAAIGRADKALYQAKASGRDCTIIAADIPERLAA